MGYKIKIVHEWKYIENKLSKSKVTKIKHLKLIFICMCQI